MPDARSIVTAPLAVARGLRFAELATVVAADALVRRAWALGRAAELVTPTLHGDLSSQYAFDVQLAREGHDRLSVPADDLAARRVAFEEERRVAAAEVLARLSVVTDLGSATTAGGELALAARTAFVKLFEEGIVEEADHVVAFCPRCRTPVDGVDTTPAELEGERLTVRLATSSGTTIELELAEPELLPGAVAVAVPDGDPAAGSTVVVPIADREVPVVVDGMATTPGVVVPAHDGASHALARTLGLVAIAVLDEEGRVVAPGPLAGLARYAARGVAKGLLEAEGVLLHAEPASDEVWRCGCCGTVLVPQLGRHWFLRAGDLEVGAADAVRDGLVAFSPAAARDAFLSSAGVRRDWCLSTLVDSGAAVPAAVCLDCGKVTVDVAPASSCGKCMGLLVAQPLFLDARFVAAIWAVVQAGWLGSSRRPVTPPAETLFVVSIADLVGWVLPAIALGLRLLGAAPCGAVVVHPWPEVDAPEDAVFLDAEAEPRVLRLALVAGSPDTAAAEVAVAALDAPEAEDVDAAAVADEVAAGVAALDGAAPATAAALLASALTAGVPAAVADRLRALALPILGD